MGKLDALDMESKMADEAEYKKQLKKYQLRILNSQIILREQKKAFTLVVEGHDAAGKGGAIKRMLERLDPRVVRVYSVAKPTPSELAHHYMRRFWLRLPPHGQIAIFDRSWYGRVLVERVEGFCTPDDWKRAYDEIHEFERQLHHSGTGIVKVFLHISKEEQLRRFEARAADPYKRWKINDEDWRNRKKWKQHLEAAEDMFERTSFDFAPWEIIPANYKWYARVQVAKIVAASLKKLVDSE